MTEQQLYDECVARYYYEDGQLKSRITNKSIGSPTANGYMQTCTNWGKDNKRVVLRIHRIIFLMHYGYMPPIVDHINGNILDNRIENLRPATAHQNSVNRAHSSRNKLGVKGVVFDARLKQYVAYIKTPEKRVRIGGFKTLAEASAAYENYAQTLHGNYAVHNR